mgnify:CR=1 FL=1
MPDTHPRLRFAEFRLDRLPSGRCSATVVLTGPGGARFEGDAQGLASQAGELRCAAQACVSALTQSVQGELSFECLGVKAIRAFDATVVIVSLATRGEGPCAIALRTARGHRARLLDRGLAHDVAIDMVAG